MEGGEEEVQWSTTRRVRVYQRQHLDSPEAEGEVEVSRIGIGKKSKTNGIVHEHLDLSI